jgi:G3E family GTPase
MRMDEKIQSDALDEVRRRLQELQRRAEAIQGNEGIPTLELFSERFMNARTSFSSFQTMVEASGIDIKEDTNELDDREDWSAFVAANTTFPGWKAMRDAALSEWMDRQFGSVPAKSSNHGV